MPVDESELRKLVERQTAELDRYTAEYVQVENKIHDHTNGVDYDQLDTGARRRIQEG